MRPGETFDRYRIEETLGRGGMGEVYRAFDDRLRRSVALKILRTDGKGLESSGGSARMLREARLAASFTHPNAIAIYDVGEVDGVTFIAMELAAGRSLRGYIRDPEVSATARLTWIVDIARALAAAHAAGLVHRDIKPDNVMVTATGIKVLDFGIAKRAGGDTTVTTSPASHHEPDSPPTSFRTAEGLVVGTPRYMAPEQGFEPHADARMDQYAWGVLAYELLAGVHPRDAADDETHGTAPLSGVDVLAPRPLRSMLGESAIASFAPHLLDEISAVVTRAMSLLASERYGSMDEVVAALSPLLDTTSAKQRQSIASETVIGTDDVAATVALSKETSRPARRLRWVVVGIGLVTVAFAAAGFIRTRGPAAGSSDPPTAAPPSTPPVPTTITDLPQPKSTNPAAVAAYVAGLQRARDGASTVESFEKCVDLDPSISQAHLRLAIDLIAARPVRAREAFRSARALRSRLDERDLGLLDAFEPYILREPADRAETARRLTKLLERFPGDAELWYRLGVMQRLQAEVTASRAALDRALELDPSYAGALVNRAFVEITVGDISAARTTLDRCLELSPASTTCLVTHIDVDRRLGDCQRLKLDARRWALAEPTSSNAYVALASADFALGASRATVEEDYRQSHGRVKDPARRKREELIIAVRLATLDGDFVSATAKQREYERLVSGEAEAWFHFTIARALVELAREAGRPGDAVDAAERALAGDRAWVRRVNEPSQALTQDTTPQLIDGLLRARRIHRHEAETRLDAWRKDWTERVPLPWAGYLWMAGGAAIADTAEEASEALASAPALPPGRLPLPWDAWVGRTYAIAGRHADAKPLLERAVASCSGLDFPLLETQAYYHLGEARAATGDVPGACAAFAKVLSRWGSAKPRSVTAESARATAARLACPR